MGNFLKKEYLYFQHLGKNAQALFVSCMLSGFSDPVLYLFLTALLYRQSQSVVPIAVYYCGFYTGLPLGFFINGKLLHKYTAQQLYWIGCLLEGFIILAIAWFSIQGLFPLWLFGVVFGLGAGLYWANRNFLTLQVVDAEKRMYYGNLESGIGTLINIVSPALIGGFFVLFHYFFASFSLFAYKIVAFFAFIILVITGFLLQKMEPVSHTISAHFVTKSSPTWQQLRLFMVTSGFFSGIIIFLPTLIIFTFLGKEGTLGIVQAVVSTLSAFVILFLAKRARTVHAYLFLAISITVSVLSTVLFGIFFSAVGALLFFLFNAFASPFSWAPYNTISFNTIDLEQKLFTFHHYNYILDQEIFLNIGRILGVGVFLGFVFFFHPLTALRITPFILATLQVVQLFFAKNLIKEYTKTGD